MASLTIMARSNGATRDQIARAICECNAEKAQDRSAPRLQQEFDRVGLP